PSVTAGGRDDAASSSLFLLPVLLAEVVAGVLAAVGTWGGRPQLDVAALIVAGAPVAVIGMVLVASGRVLPLLVLGECAAAGLAVAGRIDHRPSLDVAALVVATAAPLLMIGG